MILTSKHCAGSRADDADDDGRVEQLLSGNCAGEETEEKASETVLYQADDYSGTNGCGSDNGGGCTGTDSRRAQSVDDHHQQQRLQRRPFKHRRLILDDSLWCIIAILSN